MTSKLHYTLINFSFPQIAVYVHRIRTEGIVRGKDVAEKILSADTKLKPGDNDSLRLVDEHYSELDLTEWEPAPPPVSKPEEPGDLGTR